MDYFFCIMFHYSVPENLNSFMISENCHLMRLHTVRPRRRVPDTKRLKFIRPANKEHWQQKTNFCNKWETEKS